MPPVKERYEASVPTQDGLTPGRLAVLDKQVCFLYDVHCAEQVSVMTIYMPFSFKV